MAIRIIEVRGLDAYARFHDIQAEYEASLPPDLRHLLPAVRELQRQYDTPNAAFLAMAEDTAAGAVAVTQLDAATHVVKRLYVRPAYRRLGIARALVEGVLDFSRNRGSDRVVLDTEKERLPDAYRLYLSLGFVECAAYGKVLYTCPTFMERTV